MTEAKFAASVPRLFALSAQILGWTPDTFWQATTAEAVMALTPSSPSQETSGPSREQIAQMMERDRHE